MPIERKTKSGIILIGNEVPDMKPEEIIAPLSIFEEYTEEEILYWSSPYYDELQRKKQMQLEAEMDQNVS